MTCPNCAIYAEAGILVCAFCGASVKRATKPIAAKKARKATTIPKRPAERRKKAHSAKLAQFTGDADIVNAITDGRLVNALGADGVAAHRAIERYQDIVRQMIGKGYAVTPYLNRLVSYKNAA